MTSQNATFLSSYPAPEAAALAKIQKKIVKLGNRIRPSVTEWVRDNDRSPDGATMVLSHGLGDATCVWWGVAISLTARFRVLSVDLCGPGDSGWALDGNYKMDAMTDDIADPFRPLDLGRVAVGGHSLGAAVALRLTAAHSCEALILRDLGSKRNLLTLAIFCAHCAMRIVRICLSRPYTSVLAERHPMASADLHDPAALVWCERRSALESGLDNAKNWNLLTKVRCQALVLREVALSSRISEGYREDDPRDWRAGDAGKYFARWPLDSRRQSESRPGGDAGFPKQQWGSCRRYASAFSDRL